MRAGSRISRQYAYAALREYVQARRRLTDTLAQHGATGLRDAMRTEFALLQAHLSRIGEAVAPEVHGAVATYATTQIAGLGRHLPRVPGPEMLLSLTEAERRRMAEQTFVQFAENWTEATRARMQAELTRLEMAGEDGPAVAARLFATNVADGRASAWRHGRNGLRLGADLAVWVALSATFGAVCERGQQESGQTWDRQAIAAIDERTTDCCLNVNGQVVGLDEAFRLTGTPRYADRMMRPPFHWRCRTSVSLYHRAMETEGITTQDMRVAARDERTARQRTGRREEIHPAHATSRRG